MMMWKQLSRVVARQQQQYHQQQNLWKLSSTCRRSFVSPTWPSCMAAKTINVPTMGDSITEGTVVEWLVKPGQAVEADDVVALVETDKVTIEIKADISGVVTKHFPSVDETVEVGAPLYEIDTDATASVTGADSNGGGDSVDSSGSSSTSSTSASAGDSAKPEAPPPATKEKQSNKPSATPSEKKEHRTPSIQFLGKEGWAARLTPAPVVELPPIHPMFGRPAFSEEEMEAIMLGGAEQAPKVVAHSSGAKFA